MVGRKNKSLPKNQKLKNNLSHQVLGSLNGKIYDLKDDFDFLLDMQSRIKF